MFEELRAAGRQARSLDRLEHRPWPLPAGGWRVGQTWEELLFAHWRLPAGAVQPVVPRELELERFDGSAWIGVTSFRLTAARGRGLLPLPLVSSFLAVNVRTYVRGPDGRPGVWFLGLDVSSRLAVEVARRAFRVPYSRARISLDRSGEWRDVECARIGERGRVFSGRYRPDGEPFAAAPGSLEHFLTERFCLYAKDDGGSLRRIEIHHLPWRLQRAEAEIELTSLSPVDLQGSPVCLFSARQDALIWAPRDVGGPS